MQTKALQSILLSCCCLAGMLIGGCSKYHVNRALRSGETLTVGYEPFAPYIFPGEDPSTTGLEYELVREIARRNGWYLEARTIAWDQADQILESGKIDCLCSCVTLTPNRMRQHECTEPYLASAEVVLVRPGSGIHKLADLKGKKLAIQGLTPAWQEFTKGTLKKVGSQLKQLVPLAEHEAVLQYLKAGTVDAAVVDYWAALYWLKANPTLTIIPQCLFKTEDVLCVKRGRTALANQLQQALIDMTNDGSLLKITKRWLGAKSIPPYLLPPLVENELSKRNKSVLFIHSDSVYFLRGQQIFKGFSDYLREQGYAINFDVSAFNVSAQVNGAPAPKDIEVVKHLAEERLYDLIAVVNNPAAELFTNGTIRPKAETPLIFLSWTGELPDTVFDRLNATGIFTPPTERENIELARKLIPDTPEILVVTDATRDGSAQQENSYRNMPRSLRSKIESVSGTHYSTDELIKRASRLPKNASIILSSWSSVKDASVQDAYAVLPRLRAATGALILGKYDAYRPLGADGGILVSNEKQGRQGGHLADRILSGEAAKDIPPEIAASYTELDYAAIGKHHIQRVNIPDGIDLINVPISWVAKWSKTIIGLILLLAAMAFLYRSRQIATQKRQYRQVSALNQQLEQALTSMEYASELTHSAAFRLNLTTREISGSSMLPSLWPIRDGHALKRVEFVHPDDLEADTQATESLINGETRQITWNYRSMSFGELRYYRVLSTIDRKDSRDLFAVGVIQDITEITLNAVKVQRAQELCDRIINTIPLNFFVKDADDHFRYVLANKFLSTFLGLPTEDILGKTDTEIAGLNQVDEQISALDTAIMSMPNGREFEEFVYDSNGAIHYCHTIKRPYTDGTGRHLLMGVSMDITESYNLTKSEQITSEALRQIILDNNLDRNLDQIAHILQKFIGCDRVAYGRCDNSGYPRLYREIHNPDIPAIEKATIATYDHFWSNSKEQLLQRQIVLINRVPVMPDMTDESAKSYLAAPIFLGNSLWGVLVLSFIKKARIFSSIDENIARATSNIITIALIRANQDLAIRQADIERQVVINNINIPVALHAANGSVIHVNRATCDLLGEDEAALHTESQKDLFFLHDTVPPNSPLQQVLSGQPSATIDAKIRARDFIIRANAVTDENGQLLNIVESAQDVTDLNNALRRAQESDKAKSYFVASVSHEIRTPLNAIIGFSELLQSGKVPATEQKEYLRSIAFSGNALLQIINDVLDLSKLEAEQMQIIPEPTDFRWVAAETLRVFAHRAEEKNNTTHLEVGDIPILDIDKLRLRQILFNLIGNAIKFTQKGSVTLRASFQPESATAGTLTLEVIDTGIGISRAGLQKLAQPFVQVSGIRSGDSVTNGTGLGLAITKRLISKMGGELVIESELGKGSCFRVVLPHLTRSASQVLAADEESAIEARAIAANRSVLVVDDVPMNLKVVVAMCRNIGVSQVTTADSGLAALDILSHQVFDVILTDIWMPNMTGAELAAKIRQDPRHAATRLIAVTADSDVHGNFDLAQFTGILLKPVTVEKLRATLA